MKDIELASLFRSAISTMSKRLRKHTSSANNLSISEFTTLSYLNLTESRTPSELADLLRIKGQSMSEIVNKLQAQNIIEKNPSLTDKRKFLISLTAYGKQIVEETRYERDEWLKNAIENRLSAKEKEILRQAVVLMNKLNNFE